MTLCNFGFFWKSSREDDIQIEKGPHQAINPFGLGERIPKKEKGVFGIVGRGGPWGTLFFLQSIDKFLLQS
jgi:hypothetical protein